MRRNETGEEDDVAGGEFPRAGSVSSPGSQMSLPVGAAARGSPLTAALATAGGRKRAARPARPVLRAQQTRPLPGANLRVVVAVVTVQNGALHVVMCPRQRPPQRGYDALLGAPLTAQESLGQCAKRVLRERIDLHDVHVEQLHTFSAPERDPRVRTVAVAYYALVRLDQLTRLTDAVALRRLAVPWTGERGEHVHVIDESAAERPVAFDHGAMIGRLVAHLRQRLTVAPVAYSLLPQTFTLRALQDVHEAVRGRELNVPSFRRSMLRGDALEATGARQKGVDHRPAMLYRRRLERDQSG